MDQVGHNLDSAGNHEKFPAKNEAVYLIEHEDKKMYLELHVGADGSWDYTLYDEALQEIDGGQIGDGNEEMPLSEAVHKICQLYDLPGKDIAEVSHMDFEEKLNRDSFRYYSTQRPIMPGSYPYGPNKPLEFQNFDKRQAVETGEFAAWGYLIYPSPLTKQQIEDYELKAAPVKIEVLQGVTENEKIEREVKTMDAANHEVRHDAVLEAYITNLGKYNEGHLIGEWVKFPTTYEEIQKVFDRIGIDGVRYEEWFITDYECSVDGIYNVLGEYENLEAINYLAAKLDD